MQKRWIMLEIYELEVVDVEIKNLKDRYKIIQLSDIHIGGLIDKHFIKDLALKGKYLRC